MNDDRPSYGELAWLAKEGQPQALQAVVQRAINGPEMRCARCQQQPCGFRTKKAVAHFHLLGLCQKCQDSIEAPLS